MKKLIALLLALLMVFSMVACGQKEEPAPEKEETKTEQPAPEKEEVTLKVDYVAECEKQLSKQLGRGVILDDGSYHYCLSVLRNAEKADKSQINWNQVFGTFKLV